jgi:hypothetical protein
MARFTQGGGSGDGSALNYEQVAGTQQTVTSAPATIVSLDITTTGKPVQISVTGEGANASSGSWVRMNLFRNDVAIGNEIQIEASAVSENVPYAINFIDDVAAGTYNYSARITSKSAGAWTFGEISGPVINAVELTGFKGDTGPQGPQGEPGSAADIADFVFDIVDEEGESSRMTINNHDMIIRTTRDGSQDADIDIDSADDVWITANDEIEIDAGDTIGIRSNTDYVRIVSDRDNSNNEWTFETDGGLRFPDDTVQTTAYTGGAGGDLVVPVEIKDGDGDDFITFTRTNTNTARIASVQDDLSLRSARDITLFAGGDLGPGNVFIGWGDSQQDPDAPNRVATLADIQNANTGDITFVESTISNDTGDDIVIQNKNDDGIVKARITLDQSDEQVLIEAIASDNDSFNDTQWSTAVWSGSVVTITNTPDIINFFNNAPGNVNRVSINDGGLLTYEGAGYGPSNITINVGGTPPEGQDPLTVTEIRFYYELVSEINIDYDDSEFNIISRGMSMTIDSSGELDLKARSEDLHLYANDDVRFTANWDNNGTEYSWRMSESGKFELPGDGYIENPKNSSGDGSAYDTIKIVPDADLIEQQYHEDQYLIIDPTDPNHIHIRAGGVQDASTADLFLGAERTGIQVSDSTGDVTIRSKNPDTTNTYENVNGDSASIFAIFADLSYISPNANFSVDVDGTLYVIDSAQVYDVEGSPVTELTATPATFVTGMSYTIHESNGENYWSFNNNGYITGPAMGGIFVSGILNSEGDLYIQSSDDKVVISSDSGEFLNDSSNPNNQIATIGDVNAGRFGASASFFSTVDQGPFAADTIQAFSFNNTDWATGVSLASTNRITMTNTGKYNIAFSAQMHQTQSSGIVNVWLNKNGEPLANTNTKFAITANNPFSVAALNLFVNASAGDYYQLMWSSDSQHTVMEYEAATGSGATLHPSVPSIILTVNQVG